jgi:hypothetical protein
MIGKAAFPNCFRLRGPHNLTRLHGLHIHPGKRVGRERLEHSEDTYDFGVHRELSPFSGLGNRATQPRCAKSKAL